MEKRRHQRRRIQLEVELDLPGGVCTRTRTQDLSIGGLFVEATGTMPPAVGTVLSVVFLATAQLAGGTYSIRARVQRLNEEGVAMTFIDFSLEDLRFIETLLTP